MKWLPGMLLAAGLAGCATQPLESPRQVGFEVVTLNGAPPQRFDMDGRLAVETGQDSGQASFHWQHGPDFDRLEFYSPLGQTLGVLKWNGSGAELVDSHGDSHHGHDLASLLNQWMGWPLPVDEMSSWMVGAAAPGQPYNWFPPVNGVAGKLEQSGWQVEYLRWHRGAGHPLPEQVAIMGGRVHVKLLVRHWNVAP